MPDNFFRFSRNILNPEQNYSILPCIDVFLPQKIAGNSAKNTVKYERFVLSDKPLGNTSERPEIPLNGDNSAERSFLSL